MIDGVTPAIASLVDAACKAGPPEELLALVHLRTSQINGCAPCVDGAAHTARAAGTSEERLATVAAWRDAPWFSASERAALALAESVTRMADCPDPVPDHIWDNAAQHFDDLALASIVLMIGTANLLNRLNRTTRQVAGVWDRD